MPIRPLDGGVIPVTLEASNTVPFQQGAGMATPQKLIEPTDPTYGGGDAVAMNPVVVPGVYPDPAPIGSWVLTV